MLDSLTLRPQPVVDPLDAACEAFILSRESSRCTPKTLEHYRYTVGNFVAWLKSRSVHAVGDITPSHIRLYLVSLQKRGLKDTTQHAHARGIRAWLNWLASEGDLEVSPMRKVAMPKLDKRIPLPFSIDDIKGLLGACDRKTPKGARDYALVLALLDSGLRVSELAGLRVGDIDPRTGLATVVGKGGKQRQARFGAKARQAIARMLGFWPGTRVGDALWPKCEGVGGLTAEGVRTAIKRLGERAGVTPCGPHRFRRTFALWCLRDGMDLHSLRTLMGHSSLAVLQRYLALAGEDVERAHRQHSPVDRLL